MLITQLPIADIQTTDLVYYDPEFDQGCLKFCNNRDIDYLPSLTNPLKFYTKIGDHFEERDIPPGQMVDGLTPIFEPSLLESFRNYRVLFISLNHQLSGVVHFSDYNRPAVDAYLYSLIASYERSLRRLLVLKKFKTEDMYDYCKIVKRRMPRENLDEMKNFPPFERFFLSDLIRFATERGVIAVRDESNALRNAVMHAHEFVNLADAERGDYIYNQESFTAFFHQATVLLQDYQRVNNRIALLNLHES